MVRYWRDGLGKPGGWRTSLPLRRDEYLLEARPTKLRIAQILEPRITSTSASMDSCAYKRGARLFNF